MIEIEALAVALCRNLRHHYPALLAARYKMERVPTDEEMTDFELFEYIGKRRGFLISGGEINTERTASMLLDELRGAKIGRITLDCLTAEEPIC